MTTKQAEAITEAFKEVQNDSYDNVIQNFASKVDMEKVHTTPFIYFDSDTLLLYFL